MPKTGTAYLFTELSDAAKKHALEECRNWFTEGYDWWEYVYEWYQTEILPAEGFEVNTNENGDPKIHFSGFWSQGDGASFEAGVDILQFMRKNKLCNEFRSLAYWVRYDNLAWAKITQSGHYCHSNTMYVEAEFEHYACENIESGDRAAEQLEELSDMILSRAKELAKKLYDALQKDYEAMTTDEYVSEELEINEYYFWSNGSPANRYAFVEQESPAMLET